MVLGYHLQFVVFPPSHLLKPTGPANVVLPLTRTTQSTKTEWKCHNEIKYRSSNGTTQTEPYR